MIYILDAYNVIHKMRRLQSALDIDLRASRDALAALCGSLAAARGDITRFILVFDGRSEYRMQTQSVPPKIQVIFSETGEDADDRIIEVLESLPDRPAKCVVSDDNSVRNTARSHKAASMSVAEFENLWGTAARKSGAPAQSAGGKLSPKDADDITREYKKTLGL